MRMALRALASAIAVLALTNCTRGTQQTTYNWTVHVARQGCNFYALQGPVNYVVKFETWVPPNPNTLVFDGENVSSTTDLTLGLSATIHDDSNGYNMQITPTYKASDFATVQANAAYNCGS